MAQLKDKSKPAPEPSLAKLRERVRALEKRVEELAENHESAAPKRYMKSFGMISDDEVTRDAERLGRAYRRRQPKC
jgi:hypothetical protein